MRWVTLISLIVVGGCAGATRPEPRTAESIVREQEAPLKLVEAATGTEITLERLLSQMRNKRVVYVGERHDRPADHAVQYSLLRRLHADDSSLAIGMEMFQVPFQEPLDQWSAGEIDETVLRRETEYDQRWGFDFSMYRPMLEFARSRGLEV
ncbi:MAG: ChaN family lipoprotein, partial [Myxococcales bacterium]|nr:ChaN family lipoprotein [Myxococcales bacterium]